LDHPHLRPRGDKSPRSPLIPPPPPPTSHPLWSRATLNKPRVPVTCRVITHAQRRPPQGSRCCREIRIQLTRTLVSPWLGATINMPKTHMIQWISPAARSPLLQLPTRLSPCTHKCNAPHTAPRHQLIPPSHTLPTDTQLPPGHSASCSYNLLPPSPLSPCMRSRQPFRDCTHLTKQPTRARSCQGREIQLTRYPLPLAGFSTPDSPDASHVL